MFWPKEKKCYALDIMTSVFPVFVVEKKSDKNLTNGLELCGLQYCPDH